MDVTGVSSSLPAMSSIRAASEASIKVLDMATEAVEDTFAALLSSLDAMISGLGQNCDISI